MSPLSGSWGLVVDLGNQVQDQLLAQLYTTLWESPEFSGPQFKMGEYHGVPRAAEGNLKLQAKDKILGGSCYTKFEEDTLGYPPGWLVPLTLQLSVYGFELNLPENLVIYDFLINKANLIAKITPYRMAVICELSCFYLNADFINEDWLNLHQQSIQALILPERHPFARRHAGLPWHPGLILYGAQQMQTFWTDADESTRYNQFKQRMAEELHAPPQPLEWET